MENKPFATYFINLCHMLPLWSAISCKFFDSPNLIGSSWSSETGFKNTKQLHGDSLPSSVDEFVKRDLEFNNSTVIDASKTYLITVESDPKSSIENEKMSSFVTMNEDDEIESHFDAACSNKDAHNEEDISTQTEVACPVCADGNMPTGAHKCISCDKAVHVLFECSVSIGAEEGYGERRQCIACYRSTKKQNDQAETTQSLNEEEKWARNKRSNRGKYLNSQPNFGLVPVNKKVWIPLLLNENKLKNYYTFDKKRIRLTNTCAIDSTIQLIAAALAYHPRYRSSMFDIGDGIFRIARMLANG